MEQNLNPHGQAALMLMESLLLLLVEQRILPKGQVIEAIESVIDVKQEIAGTSGSVGVSLMSIGLLRAVAGSVMAATIPAGPTATS